MGKRQKAKGKRQKARGFITFYLGQPQGIAPTSYLFP
jgi:hypothetical protein